MSKQKTRPAPTERESKVIQHLLEYSEGNRFYADLLEKAIRYALSEGQMACVERNMETDAQKRAQKADMVLNGQVVKAGKKVTVKGTVKSTKPATGYNGEDMVGFVLALDNGCRVWGKMPVSDDCALEVDDTLTLVANVKVSPDDSTFGFLSAVKVVEWFGALEDDDEDDDDWVF